MTNEHEPDIPGKENAFCNTAPQTKNKQRIGELLVEMGFINETQLQEALKLAHEKKIKVGEALFMKGYLKKDHLYWCLSNQLGLEYIELSADMIDPQLLTHYPFHTLRSLECLPLYEDDFTVHYAVTDTTNPEILEKIRALYKHKAARFHLALPEKIRDVLTLVHKNISHLSTKAGTLQDKQKKVKGRSGYYPPEQLDALVNTILLMQESSFGWIYQKGEECRFIIYEQGEYTPQLSFTSNVHHALLDIIKETIHDKELSGVNAVRLYDSTNSENGVFKIQHRHFVDSSITWFYRIPIFSQDAFIKKYAEASSIINEIAHIFNRHKKLLIGAADVSFVKGCLASLLSTQKGLPNFPPPLFIEKEIHEYYPDILQSITEHAEKTRFLIQSFCNPLPVICFETLPEYILHPGELLTYFLKREWTMCFVTFPISSYDGMKETLEHGTAWREGELYPIYIEHHALTHFDIKGE